MPQQRRQITIGQQIYPKRLCVSVQACGCLIESVYSQMSERSFNRACSLHWKQVDLTVSIQMQITDPLPIFIKENINSCFVIIRGCTGVWDIVAKGDTCHSPPSLDQKFIHLLAQRFSIDRLEAWMSKDGFIEVSRKCT